MPAWETLETTGANALAELERLRAEYAGTGHYPFLIGDADDLEQLEEYTEDAQPAQAILAASEGINLPDWFRQRGASALEGAEEEEDYQESLEVLIGEWPEDELEGITPTVADELLSGRAKPTIHIGLVSLEAPWQLPAVIGNGGWNECPNPEAHCAVWRYWQERYGAEIISFSGDTIEGKVTRRPATREEAMELAREHYAYCADIVDQGVETLSNLAATLMVSDYWFFWWD